MRSPVLYLILVVIAAAILIPILFPSPYLLQILILVLIATTLGTAWNILGGYTGQLSLGHAAFYGVGAYSVALLSTKWGISPWAGLVLGPFFSLPFALVIGVVCFRLRGPYFALATIATAEVLKLIALNWRGLTSGAVGVVVPTLFKGISKVPYYYLALAIALLTILATYWMARSKLGYYLVAIREDEDTAESIGIDTARYKLIALLISAFFTALGGAFFASYIYFIDPDMVLSIGVSVQMSLIAIIGGLGTILGPVVGASILGVAAEVFRIQFKQAHYLIYGGLLILVILFMPEGIVGQARKLYHAAEKALRRGG